jgi:hypothetical protein
LVSEHGTPLQRLQLVGEGSAAVLVLVLQGLDHRLLDHLRGVAAPDGLNVALISPVEISQGSEEPLR